MTLIIFIKNAVKGHVKPRIAEYLGDEAAQYVYLKLMAHTADTTFTLPPEINKVVYYSDFIEADDLWDEEHYTKKIQQGKELGKRMATALEAEFKTNSPCIIIGSDSLEISADIINQAFEALNTSDVVIGPAHDGGFYLLGMNKFNAEIFKVKYSTPKVFGDTVKILETQGLKYSKLPKLYDIDTIKEVKMFAKELKINF